MTEETQNKVFKSIRELWSVLDELLESKGIRTAAKQYDPDEFGWRVLDVLEESCEGFYYKYTESGAAEAGDGATLYKIIEIEVPNYEKVLVKFDGIYSSWDCNEWNDVYLVRKEIRVEPVTYWIKI